MEAEKLTEKTIQEMIQTHKKKLQEKAIFIESLIIKNQEELKEFICNKFLRFIYLVSYFINIYSKNIEYL